MLVLCALRRAHFLSRSAHLYRDYSSFPDQVIPIRLAANCRGAAAIERKVLWNQAL
jgi:hypothetical protein